MLLIQSISYLVSFNSSGNQDGPQNLNPLCWHKHEIWLWLQEFTKFSLSLQLVLFSGPSTLTPTTFTCSFITFINLFSWISFRPPARWLQPQHPSCLLRTCPNHFCPSLRHQTRGTPLPLFFSLLVPSLDPTSSLQLFPSILFDIKVMQDFPNRYLSVQQMMTGDTHYALDFFWVAEQFNHERTDPPI